MSPALAAYLECALWSSCESDEEGRELFHYDAKYSLDDFTPEAIGQAEKELAEFIEVAGEILTDWPDEQIGHDFWLTRNRHGAGFWDRGKPYGRELTNMAHVYGEAYLYETRDGKVGIQ